MSKTRKSTERIRRPYGRSQYCFAREEEEEQRWKLYAETEEMG